PHRPALAMALGAKGHTCRAEAAIYNRDVAHLLRTASSYVKTGMGLLIPGRRERNTAGYWTRRRELSFHLVRLLAEPSMYDQEQDAIGLREQLDLSYQWLVEAAFHSGGLAADLCLLRGSVAYHTAIGLYEQAMNEIHEIYALCDRLKLKSPNTRPSVMCWE